MKIEIGESLGYSYLRHVKGCWLVQTNWKPSEHWAKCLDDDALELAFRKMQDEFDLDGQVFKGTRNSGQFLKQAEIDVVGVDQSGAIHAMDIAFHEAGLNYLGGPDKRVLKKLLRAKLVLDAYRPAEVERHIYFVSPKVNPGVLAPIKEIIKLLKGVYQPVHWHLLVNESFCNEMLEPTLERSDSVADTAELFVRSAKSLDLAHSSPQIGNGRSARLNRFGSDNGRKGEGWTTAGPYTLQDIVQRLMLTLLEEHQSLLSDSDRRNLMDPDYCGEQLGLRLGRLPMLRQKEQGRSVSGHDRYYEKTYAAEFLVTNNWWRRHHSHNAGSLLRFVDELMGKNSDNAGFPALKTHRAELLRYLNDFSA